jgi:hypothetical protein
MSTERHTPAAAMVPDPELAPGTDPATVATGTTTPRTSRTSPGAAPVRSLAEATRADTLVTQTEVTTTGGTSEAAAAVPAEGACPGGDHGRGGKHYLSHT